MGQGPADPSNLLRPQPPVELGLPNRRIRRTASEAIIDPPPCVGELAGADRQVGPPEPDAVVLGCLPAGAIEDDPERVHGQRPEIDPDMVTEQSERLLGSGPTRPAGV